MPPRIAVNAIPLQNEVIIQAYGPLYLYLLETTGSQCNFFQLLFKRSFAGDWVFH